MQSFEWLTNSQGEGYTPMFQRCRHILRPDYEEDQQIQQHSNEYWAAHFRSLIADRGPHGQSLP
jgi:hypothetical protein